MKKLSKQHIVTLLGIGSIFLVIGVNSVLSANKPVPVKQQQPENIPLVSTINISASEEWAVVRGYGEVNAVHQLVLKAEVSGRVTELSPRLRSGEQFSKGDWLVKTDDTPYQQALAQARVNLADAELELQQAERNADRAEKEWKRSGLSGEPASALVLYQPQLKAARMRLEARRKEVRSAQADLNKTIVRAPFDALLVSRSVQPGLFIQAGENLVELYDISEAEVRVFLSDLQWKNLPSPEQLKTAPWPVELHSIDGQQKWQGEVKRVEQHLSTDTRQRAVIVSVEYPLNQKTPLYPGSYVYADIRGAHIENLWKLPASALTQDGNIWLVNEKNQLDDQKVTVRFSSGDNIYVDALPASTQANVVSKPLRSYMKGMRVSQQKNNVMQAIGSEQVAGDE